MGHRVCSAVGQGVQPGRKLGTGWGDGIRAVHFCRDQLVAETQLFEHGAQAAEGKERASAGSGLRAAQAGTAQSSALW